MLQVRGKEELIEIVNDLNKRGISCTTYTEADLNNEVTAIAVLSEEKLFKKLKLMGA